MNAASEDAHYNSVQQWIQGGEEGGEEAYALLEENGIRIKDQFDEAKDLGKALMSGAKKAEDRRMAQLAASPAPSGA